MTASFTLLVLSSKDRGASSPSILYPKEESGTHCLLIFVLKPRSAGLKFGSTILEDIIAKMPYKNKATTEDLVELLPHKWKLQHPEAVMEKVRNLAK